MHVNIKGIRKMRETIMLAFYYYTVEIKKKKTSQIYYAYKNLVICMATHNNMIAVVETGFILPSSVRKMHNTKVAAIRHTLIREGNVRIYFRFATLFS